MAQTLSEDSATKKHNVKARAEAISDAMTTIYNLDNDIQDALEEHVKPLRTEKSEIKSKLAEDYQLAKAAFNVEYNRYRLQQKAIEAEDNITLDTLRELHNAMPLYGQANMDDALKQTNGAAGSA